MVAEVAVVSSAEPFCHALMKGEFLMSDAASLQVVPVSFH
jgi:hypothetical protein